MSSYVNANVGITCIELLPGEPVQVFPRRLPRLPPSNFVDRNDYCFKLVDGQMRLRGIELRPDWENWPVTPDKLSCYREKGEESMSKPTGRPKREAPPKKELLALFEKHEGKVAPIAEELKASWAYAKRWLIDAGIIDSLGNPTSEYNFEWYEPKKKQTLPPKPEQAANQEPDEGEGESATDSIPYSVERIENIGKDIPPIKMPIGCSLPLEDSTEPRDDEMAEGDTVEKTNGLYLLSEAGECDLCEMTPEDKNLLETVLNAYFAVKRVQSDPVALALMKRVLESGVPE